MAVRIELELSDEKGRALREEAERLGRDVSDYAKQLLEGHPSAVDVAGNARAVALLRSWSEEDAAMSPEEKERAAQEWAEIEASLEAHPLSFRSLEAEG